MVNQRLLTSLGGDNPSYELIHARVLQHAEHHIGRNQRAEERDFGMRGQGIDKVGVSQRGSKRLRMWARGPAAAWRKFWRGKAIACTKDR